MTTIETLVNYVIEHRRGKAFDGWTPLQLAEAFIEAVNDRLLLYAEVDGHVYGVIHCLRFDDTIHVVNVLTTRKGILKTFVAQFTKMYPGFQLSGERHGKLKSYDTPRLVTKILQQHY